jgi:hypothetical protein
MCCWAAVVLLVSSQATPATQSKYTNINNKSKYTKQAQQQEEAANLPSM